MIVAVDGVDVVRSPLDHVKELVLGETGTLVTLSLRRGGHVSEVTLMRGINVSSDEVERLRAELSAAMAELSKLRAALRAAEVSAERSRTDNHRLTVLALVFYF